MAPRPSLPSAGTYVHRVDRALLIEYFNDAWADFARQNGVADLPHRVLGTSLLDHVSGALVKHFTRELVRRARATRTGLTVPVRCDGPHVRRLMSMRIVPRRGGRTEFVATLVAEEPRAPQPFFDPSSPRSDALVFRCSWCSRVRVGEERWMELEDALGVSEALRRWPPPRAGHTVCADCFRGLIEETRVALPEWYIWR